MTKTNAGPISADRLRSFVERYETLEEERKAISGDMRDVLTEAKGVGYDVSTIRWLVKERKVDAAERDERDQLRDVYAHALGMAVSLVEVGGLSLRKAAKQAGVSKSSLHRALSVPAVSQTAKPGQEEDGGPESASNEESSASAPAPDVDIEIPPFLDRRHPLERAT